MKSAEIFSRYAYPPNELGYCGPADSSEVLACVPENLEKTVRCFEGTWPYFEFIADQTGHKPLDPEVVTDYWLAGPLTDSLDVKTHGASLLHALAQAGGVWAHSPSDLLPGMTPDHNFHVFAIYPWLGLLRRNLSDQPRLVLDRCRIRWGTVLSIAEGTAQVESAAIEWDDSRLSLGPRRIETVTVTRGPVRLAGDLSPGDSVAMHWDWVCDVISTDRLDYLRRSTATHLDIANQRLDLGLVG